MASANSVVSKLRQQARNLVDDRGQWEAIRREFRAHGKEGLVALYEEAKEAEEQGSFALTGIPLPEQVLDAINALDAYLDFVDSEQMAILLKIAS